MALRRSDLRSRARNGYLIPEGIRHKATPLICRGIRNPEEEEQAAIQYFEKRGIVRPAVPWLARGVLEFPVPQGVLRFAP